jgi:hypothetical protein
MPNSNHSIALSTVIVRPSAIRASAVAYDVMYAATAASDKGRQLAAHFFFHFRLFAANVAFFLVAGFFDRLPSAIHFDVTPLYPLFLQYLVKVPFFDSLILIWGFFLGGIVIFLSV